jgi:hypothetical protein
MTRLVGVQVLSDERCTQLVQIVGNITGAKLIGECLSPVSCLSLDRGDQETVLFGG